MWCCTSSNRTVFTTLWCSLNCTVFLLLTTFGVYVYDPFNPIVLNIVYSVPLLLFIIPLCNPFTIIYSFHWCWKLVSIKNCKIYVLYCRVYVVVLRSFLYWFADFSIERVTGIQWLHLYINRFSYVLHLAILRVRLHEPLLFITCRNIICTTVPTYIPIGILVGSGRYKVLGSNPLYFQIIVRTFSNSFSSFYYIILSCYYQLLV